MVQFVWWNGQYTWAHLQTSLKECDFTEGAGHPNDICHQILLIIVNLCQDLQRFGLWFDTKSGSIRHSFLSKYPVCFGISISNFMCTFPMLLSGSLLTEVVTPQFLCYIDFHEFAWTWFLKCFHVVVRNQIMAIYWETQILILGGGILVDHWSSLWNCEFPICETSNSVNFLVILIDVRYVVRYSVYYHQLSACVAKISVSFDTNLLLRHWQWWICAWFCHLDSQFRPRG